MNQVTQELSKAAIEVKRNQSKNLPRRQAYPPKAGMSRISIKNICEEAGVSNGSFYHHFKTKDDLLSYYIEEQPSINPDLLICPKMLAEAKAAIIQVYS